MDTDLLTRLALMVVLGGPAIAIDSQSQQL
jgi:hypothetical protein